MTDFHETPEWHELATTTQNSLRYLRDCGVPVTGFVVGDDLVDDEITITDFVSVQVDAWGHYYVVSEEGVGEGGEPVFDLQDFGTIHEAEVALRSILS